MLVGVTGFAKHGKDTVGRLLVERWGYWRFGFADQLKDMAERVNPFVDVLSSEGTAIGIEPGYMRLGHILDLEGWEGAKKVSEVRRFLQVLGTDAVRDIIGPDSWVQALDRRIAEAGYPERTVITDVRFHNEVTYIHDRGGYVVRVVRPEFDNGVGTNHPSEFHIPSLNADIEIINDSTLEDLDRAADRLIDELLA